MDLTIGSNQQPSVHPVKTGSDGDHSGKTTNVSSMQPDAFFQDMDTMDVSEAAFAKVLEKAKKALEGTPHTLEYSVHDNGTVIVKVLNSETKEVLREIPSEKMVDLIDKLMEISGMIIDEKR